MIVLCLNAEGIADVTGSFLEGLDVDGNFNILVEFVVLFRRVLVNIETTTGRVLYHICDDFGGRIVVPGVDRSSYSVNDCSEKIQSGKNLFLLRRSRRWRSRLNECNGSGWSSSWHDVLLNVFNPKHIDEIADFLGVSPSYLLRGIEDGPNEGTKAAVEDEMLRVFRNLSPKKQE